MELYDDKILKIIKEEQNPWPVQVLTSNNDIIAFNSDIAIATHYIEVVIENKKYYGQKILILKESK